MWRLKLSNVVKNDVVKKTECNELVKKINNIITYTSELVMKTKYNTKINEIENKALRIMIMINYYYSN